MFREGLLIVGAGGFAREAYHWIADVREDILGFYSQTETRDFILSERVYDCLVDEMIGKEFFVAIGDPVARRRMWVMCEEAGMKPCAPIIHPSAIVGTSNSIDPGTILCPGVVVTTGVKIGRGVILNLHSTVGHDAQIGDFCTVAPGVNISGNVTLEERVMLGTNSAVREKKRIGHDSIIGMGASVISDVPPGEVYTGVPAKRMK